MFFRRSFPKLRFFPILLLITVARGESPIPAGSRIATADPSLQRLLLSPLESDSVLHKGGFRLSSPEARPLTDVPPKCGMHALRLSGHADTEGAKGDFTIVREPAGEISTLGAWMHHTAGANVSEAGFQVTDAEGEALVAWVKVDWEGWKWVELDLAGSGIRQAYKQEGKSGKAEFPLKNISIVWISPAKGPTMLGVDGLAALARIDTPREPISLSPLAPPWGEAGHPFHGGVLIHNFSDKARTLRVSTSLQANPQYLTPALPHPVRGSDHARGRPSWFEITGQRMEDNTLTDGDDDSHFQPPASKEPPTEIFNIVDLGTVRTVTSLSWIPADANWLNKLDVHASADGSSWTPVKELQNLDIHKEWGRRDVDVREPFPARYIRLRHHNEGQPLSPFFRSFSSLSVHDGTGDEEIAIPTVGKPVTADTVMVEIPPRDFRIIHPPASPPLGPDAYYAGILAEDGDMRKTAAADYFVMPPEPVSPSPESRFGINVSNPAFIPPLARAGFGWVRFENLKWRFFNPAPGDFRFDGSVAPWKVPMDDYFRRYQEAGMSILPYIFETPEWAVEAPAGIQKNRRAYPPRDTADYARAIHQAVARYASEAAPADKLLTPDKLTALGRIHTYELWNEPNLSDPGWGFFAAPLDRYYPLFRAGAEAAKQADPTIRVTNGGWAGLSMEWIDTMRTFRYPDGKSPIDFTDVLNVHFYAGKDDPEHATKDPNAFREGVSPGEIQTLEKDLIDLADWRDQLKPGMPIWVTETGHDVGGPIGRTERHQAAKLPRGAMLSFANGIEKVFIYRETGSTPAHHAGAGLMRDDGSLRASYFTIATLIRQLHGVTDTRVPRLPAADPKVWMYLWKRPGGDVLTAWAPGGGATLGIDLGRCKVTSAFGAVSEEEVTRNFPLGDFPVYISSFGDPGPLATLVNQAGTRETDRKERLARLSKATAHLFDFGSREFAGTMKLGGVRPFTTVLKEDLYDGLAGHGFAAVVAGKNNSAHWIRSLLEKDDIHLHQPAVFKVRVGAGTHEVRFKGTNFKADATLTATASGRTLIDVPLPTGKDTLPATAIFTISSGDAGQPIEFHFPPGRIQWLSVVEKLSDP